MARGNLVLGTARGKLGDIVTYRSLGQQMSRVRVRDVKNPKTLAQMIQRVVLSSASKTVAALEPIINHSYQSVAYGPESRRHAQREFMKILRAQAVLAYNSETGNKEVGLLPLSAVGASVAEFPISQGSLFPTRCMMQMVGSRQAVLYCSGLPADPSATLGDFLSAMGADINTQFTFVFLRASEVGDSPSGGNFFVGLPAFVRINFLPDADLTARVYSGEGSELAFNSAIIDATRSNDIDKLIVFEDAQQVTFDDGAEASVCAGTIIKSKYQDGKWLRSTQYLSVGYPETGTPDQALWGWNDYEDIVDSVYTGDIVPEDRYLNKEKN